MIKDVSNTFTYEQFEEHIKYLFTYAKRIHYLEAAIDTNIDHSFIDVYISLLADMFPDNNENYFVDYQEFWDNWHEIVECVIISFVYGVLDYTEDGNVLAPYNHELLHLKSIKDATNKDSKEYTVPISSIKDLWQICTGEIPVRERFS